MFTINRENLRNSHQLIWFTIDFLMLGLLIVNLMLLIFDMFYGIEFVQAFFQNRTPGFAELYNPIHENFAYYDLMFVAVFLTEFFLRWAYALKTRLYRRWYFYPFIHWYDLLGCIPTSGFRFLRILRVITIIYRLQRYNIIDVTRTRTYQFFSFYYEAFMEELSDRIVTKVLSGAQEELRRGSPLFNRILHDILYPRRDMLADWLSARVAQTAREGYLPNRGALRNYLENRVDYALKQNVELSRLKYLPVVGPTIQETLEDAVGDIVATVIHQLLDDLASTRNHAFIDDLVRILLPDPGSRTEDPVDTAALIDLINEVLDAVKAQVSVKHWREEL